MMKLKQMRIAVSLIAVIFCLSACYYDSEEALYGDSDGPCDTSAIRYSVHVTAILQSNCYACHSNGSNIGNLLLDSHTAARNAAQNGSLMGSVNHAPGFSPIPQGAAKLLDCEIQTLQAWVDAGTPNN